MKQRRSAPHPRAFDTARPCAYNRHMKKTTSAARKRGTRPGTVEEYLAALPPKPRAALEKLRKQVRAAAPEAAEGIGYGMPAFTFLGTLVYFAAYDDHLSFFAGNASLVREYAAELQDYDTSKGTIRFTADEPLPATLVKKLVRARVAENRARSAARGRKPLKPGGR